MGTPHTFLSICSPEEGSLDGQERVISSQMCQNSCLEIMPDRSLISKQQEEVLRLIFKRYFRVFCNLLKCFYENRKMERPNDTVGRNAQG